jgi:GT2 family glycosyltransferase
MSVDLSIIIVNWNVKPLLERCLQSIFQETSDISYEVFVVDNASADGGVEMIKERFSKRVKLIANKENLGFAKACNQAIAQSQGKYILLLNPDTEITDNALTKAVNFMRTHSRCGILGVRLLGVDDEFQPSVRRFPTFGSQFLILLKLHWIFPRVRPLNKYFVQDFDYSKTQEIDQVMGAFLMTRRRVIDEVGPLDENFFVWFEEVDFCRRVKQAGWKVYYTPEVEIIHYGSQSFKQVLPFKKQKMYNNSMLYYFQKHHSKTAWRILRFFYPPSLFLASLCQIFRIKRY